MVAQTQTNKDNRQPGFGALRKKAFQLLAAMIIFISGLITGACLIVFTIKDRVAWTGPPPTHATASEIAWEIRDKFDLSDEQTKKVEKIFKTVVESLNTMREDYASQMQASQKNTIEQMKQVLSEQQFNAWYEDFTRKINRGPKHEPGGRPGPGHGPGPEPGFGPEPGSDFGHDAPPPLDFEGQEPPGPPPDEDTDRPY